MASLAEFATPLTGHHVPAPDNLSPASLETMTPVLLPVYDSEDLNQTYGHYEDIIAKGRVNATMSQSDKRKLINEIDRLESKDHIGILKTIINHSKDRKVYTVNNRGTYVDLNDLSGQCLWDICYYVKLCLQNQKREQDKIRAHKEYLDDQRKLEDQMWKQSKLRLTGRSQALSPVESQSQQKKSVPQPVESKSDESEDDDEESELGVSLDPTTQIDPFQTTTKIMRPGEFEFDDLTDTPDDFLPAVEEEDDGFISD